MGIVNLENVWVIQDSTTLLEDITLSIEKDDFLSIIGPNGAGKTTLLKVILGLIHPDKGSVTVFNGSPQKRRKKIGYLSQRIQFDPQFPISVFDVVLMGRYTPFATYTQKDRISAQNALHTVNMFKYATRQIGTLSGGELQRIFLARALTREPDLLLLDEPTSGIDPEMRKSFYELLVNLNETMAIVLVTHDISVVSVYVDSIACLNRKLYYHGGAEGALEKLEDVYQCPIEVLAHGVPHRVLKTHESGE
ncbi:MAG: ABC transporter ATP-binding protein [Candidatus Methanofastidiosia archaeon]|jgi:zinc transport system ATP-binding protein